MFSINTLRDRQSIGRVAEQLGVHVSTVWRWVLRGVRGRKLATVTIGGRRYILAASLEAFLADSGDRNKPSEDARQRADHAGAILDSRGVTVRSKPHSPASRR